MVIYLQNEAENKQVTLPKVVAPEKTKPLRGPQPNKDATLPDDNPLVKSTKARFPKSPVRRTVTPRGMNKTVSGNIINFVVIKNFPTQGYWGVARTVKKKKSPHPRVLGSSKDS